MKVSLFKLFRNNRRFKSLKLEYTTSYNPLINNKSEQMNHTLLNNARAILIDLLNLFKCAKMFMR